MSDDVHKKTAAALFGVPEEEVTLLQRRDAATANFHHIYGGIHDSVELEVAGVGGIPEDPFAFLRALHKKDRWPEGTTAFTAEPSPMRADVNERTVTGRGGRAGPRFRNMPIQSVESGLMDRIRAKLPKVLALQLPDESFERRLLWLIARETWTLQDRHWRDGEE